MRGRKTSQEILKYLTMVIAQSVYLISLRIRYWFNSTILPYIKKHVLSLVPILISIIVLIAMVSNAKYNNRLNAVLAERTSIENLIANGNLEAALRLYKEVADMRLGNAPQIYAPVYGLWSSTPNREPLWIVIKTALHQRASKYRAYVSPEQCDAINLAYVDLKDTKLAGCDFALTDFYRANLQGADLRGANFSKAFLLETDLSNCNLGVYPGVLSQFTRLDIDEENAGLYEVVKGQLIPRTENDSKRNQRYHVDDGQIELWTKQLSDSSWQIRHLAVCGLDELPDDQKTDKVRQNLVALLRKEMTVDINGEERISASIRAPEIPKEIEKTLIISYEGYFFYLLQAAARTQDSAAIQLLVCFDAKKHEFLIGTLVQIGEPAIAPLIDVVKTGTPTLRRSAAWVLGAMLSRKQNKYIESMEARAVIKEGLVTAYQQNSGPADSMVEWQKVKSECSKYLPDSLPTKSNGWFNDRCKQKYEIQRYIIRALRMSEDSDVIPILEEIAQTDAYTERRQDGTIRYPIRTQAERVIIELREINQ